MTMTLGRAGCAAAGCAVPNGRPARMAIRVLVIIVVSHFCRWTVRGKARPDGELGGLTAVQQYKRTNPRVPARRGNLGWKEACCQYRLAFLPRRGRHRWSFDAAADCIAPALVPCLQFWIAL